MNLVSLALDALTDLPSALHPNEFAYLALTSKIKGPFRDRWAYVMHCRSGEGVIVAREWGPQPLRVDIAVLMDGDPRLLIELKAWSAFDPSETKGYVAKMQADEAKARGVAPHADILTVLLVNHPQCEIPACLQGVVKNNLRNDRMIRRYTSSEGRDEAVAAVDRCFLERDSDVIKRGDLPVGCAFGVPVDILYWAVKSRMP